MQDYKLVYGLMDKLKANMSNEAISEHFSKLAEEIKDPDQKDDWYLAIIHWDMANNKTTY